MHWRLSGSFDTTAAQSSRLVGPVHRLSITDLSHRPGALPRMSSAGALQQQHAMSLCHWPAIRDRRRGVRNRDGRGCCMDCYILAIWKLTKLSRSEYRAPCKKCIMPLVADVVAGVTCLSVDVSFLSVANMLICQSTDWSRPTGCIHPLAANKAAKSVYPVLIDKRWSVVQRK